MKILNAWQKCEEEYDGKNKDTKSTDKEITKKKTNEDNKRQAEVQRALSLSL